MTGTIQHQNRSDPQTFRYVSLSSGLDIVRKTLGNQQIAITQTTDVDRTNGVINLTTMLIHTSGEWIHRTGRYASFQKLQRPAGWEQR